MRIVTNNKDFYNYIQSKFVECLYWDTPIEGELNIMFPTTHNITVCGNRFNEQRIESGNFQNECNIMTDMLEVPNTVLITPVTQFGGKVMREHVECAYSKLKNLQVSKQVIDTRNLGELIVPHRIQIWSNNGTTLKKTDVRQLREEWFVYNGKRQQKHYINVINKSKDTLERRKLRYIPEYAVFSALYEQVVKKYV